MEQFALVQDLVTAVARLVIAVAHLHTVVLDASLASVAALLFQQMVLVATPMAVPLVLAQDLVTAVAQVVTAEANRHTVVLVVKPRLGPAMSLQTERVLVVAPILVQALDSATAVAPMVTVELHLRIVAPSARLCLVLVISLLRELVVALMAISAKALALVTAAVHRATVEAYLTIAHPNPVNPTMDPAILARPFPQTVFADRIRPRAQLVQAVRRSFVVWRLAVIQRFDDSRLPLKF